MAAKHNSSSPGARGAATAESVVSRAIDQANELLAESQQLRKDRSTPLVDPNTTLDSLSVINLLVFIEDEFREAFDREIVLAGEIGDATLTPSALRTVGSLTDALDAILRGES
jgi:acyl carrier protein